MNRLTPFPVPHALESTVAVILAAGTGTRMRSDPMPKVVHPVGGVPALRRLMGTLAVVGIRRQVIVTPPEWPSGGGIVRRAAWPHGPGIGFVVQHHPRGTGEAAKIGLNALRPCRGNRPILITAGDKVVDPAVFRRLLMAFADGADLALAAGRRADFPTAGRLVREQGRWRIVETPDLRFQEFLVDAAPLLAEAADRRSDPPRDAVLALAARRETRPARLEAWCRQAAEIARAHPGRPDRVRVAVHHRTSDERSPAVTAADRVNLSLYICREALLRAALALLDAANSQGEYYLTDAVEAVARLGEQSGDGATCRVAFVPVGDPGEAMAFNTSGELRAVRTTFRRRQRAVSSPPRPASKSGHAAAPTAPAASAGRWTAVLPARGIEADAVAAMISAFGARGPIRLARAPGRINLMGRHIDHQGGIVHPVCIDHAVIIAWRPRNDDRVRIAHADPDRHAMLDIRTPEGVLRLGPGAWRTAAAQAESSAGARAPRARWHRYLLAALARIQFSRRDRALRGIDAIVAADLPEGAGLSSSSALVCAAALALWDANGDTPTRSRAIRAAGEAEWFVGTRGGFADHAAILGAPRGRIAAMTELGRWTAPPVPLPPDTAFAAIISPEPAWKAGPARGAFNARIDAYREATVRLVAAGIPGRGTRPRRLADLLPSPRDADGVARLLEAVADLPHTTAANAVSVRGVALFGFAEMARSIRFGKLLTARDPVEAGALMNVSHDGDRVSRLGRDRVRQRWTAPTGPARLRRAAQQIRSGTDPYAVLGAFPGAYRCSTEAIDRIVDTVAAVPGVLGAQICGAGLGGAVAAWYRSDVAAQVARAGERAGGRVVPVAAGGPAGFLRPRSGGPGSIPPWPDRGDLA